MRARAISFHWLRARARLDVGAIILAVAQATACESAKDDTPPPAHAGASELAIAGAGLAIAVGDIGVCGRDADERTAQLADSILRADSAAHVPAIVLTLGDNAYPAGLDLNFVRCFGTSWGDPKKRMMSVMHPSIGNHDYQSRRGAAYYRYFGRRAGPAFKGYYSFDFAGWHVIALNSEIIRQGIESEVKAQAQWLENDLRTNAKLCTLAYFHRPAFSSGAHGSSYSMRDLWKTLADAGVDVVLNGHEHHYERFLPQNGAGVLDTLRGMEQIIAGTGGGELTGIRSQLAANSAARVRGKWGILLLTLGPSEYRTAFLGIDGRIWDSSGRRCH